MTPALWWLVLLIDGQEVPYRAYESWQLCKREGDLAIEQSRHRDATVRATRFHCETELAHERALH